MSYKTVKDKFSKIIKGLRMKPLRIIHKELKDRFFQDMIKGMIYERLQEEGTDKDGRELRTDRAIQTGNDAYSPKHKTKAFQGHV